MKAKTLGLAAVVLAGCGVTTAVAGASGGSAVAAASHLITLKQIQFHPGTLHIKRGESVTWKWEDADIDTQHNVTSTGAKHFKSSTTKMTGTYTVKFTKVGTYKFECTIHPESMTGAIIVQ
jgi:plastocyanin